jgi:hypothetical protein
MVRKLPLTGLEDRELSALSHELQRKLSLFGGVVHIDPEFDADRPYDEDGGQSRNLIIVLLFPSVFW